MYHCSCHGNLVTIATRYVVDAYRPIELLRKILRTSNDLRNSLAKLERAVK